MMPKALMLLLSVPVLLITALLFLWRADFYLNSVETSGSVVKIEAQNDTCSSGGKHKRRYACTEFDAIIQYKTPEGNHEFSIGAGHTRGSNQPTSTADRRVGQRVNVRYDSRNHNSAAEDSVFGVWGAPIAGLLMQFTLMIGSVLPSRHSYR